MSSEPTSITRSGWYRLIPGVPKPETWDLCVGNGQHLGWDRCWAFVLTHVLGSRELSIVWSIGYAMKAACEEVAAEQAQAAYERGWRDACDDHLDQAADPDHPIGERHQSPYDPDLPKVPRRSA
jgi:hypothetical protein